MNTHTGRKPQPGFALALPILLLAIGVLGLGMFAASSAQAKPAAQTGGGVLLVPDWTGDRVMSFDPQTGNLLNLDFIPGDPAHLSSPKEAMISPTGDSIIVSDQLEDVVQEYNFNGTYIGVFAPASGVSTTIMNNIRGIELRPNRNLLVTVADGTNADSVVQFDPNGNYLGQFITTASGGLNSPFDVLSRTLDYLVSGTDSDAIHRYGPDGTYLGNFTSINTFPQQIALASNGNVLVANFSGTETGVLEYTPGGTFVGRYAPVTGNRGVYELGNGNILTTSGTGVYEINRAGQLVSTKASDVNAQYITLVMTSTQGTPTTTVTPIATLTRTASPSSTSMATTTATSTVVSTATSTVTPCPINFSDVLPTDWYYEYVRCAYCMGAVSGYNDGTFRPHNNATRGQMTKIVVLAFQYDLYTPPAPTFRDVPADHPFYQYVETAAFNNIVSGYDDGTFRPFFNVTRGQLSKIVVVAAAWPTLNPADPTFIDVPLDHPFYSYVETAVCHQIISGYDDRTFRPYNDATRAQISKIVCLATQNLPCVEPPVATATPGTGAPKP